MSSSASFGIVGGGIGGLTLAIALQRKGFTVNVYENAPEFKPLGAGIVLAANALKAYQEIGIVKQIIDAGHKLLQLRILDSNGRQIATTNAAELARKHQTFETRTFHRADLHRVLLENLLPDTLHFSKGVTDFMQHDDGVDLKFNDGSSVTEDFVIAADGIHSIFRKKLLHQSTLRYSGYTCWRGLIDSWPEGRTADEASESWGSGKRFGIVPLSRERTYWFATVDAAPADARFASFSLGDLALLFRGFHHPVGDIILSSSTVLKNDISDFPPITRFAFDNIVLLGDAAHATTPNMGQGACLAIEDAAVLANSLVQHADPVQAFKHFELKRIKRTTQIVNASYALGRVAQIKNPVLARLRNTAMRMAPSSFSEMQMKKLYNVSFT
jgi:2-polyprenyl-6-methoxyphenol hydroxylase-like FAD-dependent oxidoreductase